MKTSFLITLMVLGAVALIAGTALSLGGVAWGWLILFLGVLFLCFGFVAYRRLS